MHAADYGQPADSDGNVVDPMTPVVKAHYSLASGRETYAVVAYTRDDDGCPTLPFLALGEIVYLRALDGDLIAMASVHRIEGLPEWQPAPDGD